MHVDRCVHALPGTVAALQLFTYLHAIPAPSNASVVTLLDTMEKSARWVNGDYTREAASLTSFGPDIDVWGKKYVPAMNAWEALTLELEEFALPPDAPDTLAYHSEAAYQTALNWWYIASLLPLIAQWNVCLTLLQKEGE